MKLADEPNVQSQIPQSGATVAPATFARHNGVRYRTPFDLQVTPTPLARFLVIGGCLAQAFGDVAALIDKRHRGDFILLNNFDALPDIPADDAAAYDFQIIQIPLRTILGSAYFRLPDDGSQHEDFLHQTQEALSRYLTGAMKLNVENRLLTFVLGFLVPQQNPLGRFAPRYDLRNVMHFIERLNMFLAGEIAKFQNAHFVDADQISAGMGKKYCQDDIVWSFTHGTTLSDGDHDHDLGRIQPPAPMQQHYSARWMAFFESLLHEIFAMHRTSLRLDSVKLVAIDLDDTLWRGIAAEGTLGIAEGWPMGLVETLLILKQRGILLAIVSKNDELFIKTHWEKITGGQIALEDFAIRRINFEPKAKNLAEIISQVNLRPVNVVMIDDNPAEREAIREQIPGVRVLGRHVYYLKRILLWSTETQQPAATDESNRRTQMVQAQLQRENAREGLSHEQFLQSLQLRVTLSILGNIKDVQMNRALELFNKTNQFNTTGQRYTLADCARMINGGWHLHVIEAADRFTHYGLIGAAWVRQNCIEDLVMSCRALGLGIEESFLACLAGRLAGEGKSQLLGKLITTEANIACRNFFSRNGFMQESGDAAIWSRSLEQPMPIPQHVAITSG